VWRFVTYHKKNAHSAVGGQDRVLQKKHLENSHPDPEIVHKVAGAMRFDYSLLIAHLRQ
jgi:hypothetical protein